jgi:hypothetical protein
MTEVLRCSEKLDLVAGASLASNIFIRFASAQVSNGGIKKYYYIARLAKNSLEGVIICLEFLLCNPWPAITVL